MDSPRLIFFLLLYVIVVSSSVALFAVGMGLDGFDVNSSVPVNFTAPTDAGLLNSNFATALVQTILGVLFWTVPETILPMWANIVFVKIPLVCLIAAIVEVLLP